MSTTWYAKIDCNFHANRKARKAGRLGREVFVFILCLNAQKGSPGFLSTEDLDPDYVAEQLQMTRAEAQRGIEACQAAKLISVGGGIAQIAGWNEGYARRGTTSAERMASKRERDKAAAGEPSEAPKSPQRDRGEPRNENVTPACDGHPSLGDGSVTCDVVSKEVREGGKDPSRADSAPPYDHDDLSQRGALARRVYEKVSEARGVLSAELGMSPPRPFPPVTPGTHSEGFRDLLDRVREEGPHAPEICNHVLEVLIADARKSRSIDWLSEKAFKPGSWRTAREKTPKWRAANLDQRKRERVFIDDDGTEFVA